MSLDVKSAPMLTTLRWKCDSWLQ